MYLALPLLIRFLMNLPLAIKQLSVPTHPHKLDLLLLTSF